MPYLCQTCVHAKDNKCTAPVPGWFIDHVSAEYDTDKVLLYHNVLSQHIVTECDAYYERREW